MEKDCVESPSEWVVYFEEDFNSLDPVDVMLDQKNVVENVILFEDAIYDHDYEVCETDGVCHIKLKRLKAYIFHHITHYRKQ